MVGLFAARLMSESESIFPKFNDDRLLGNREDSRRLNDFRDEHNLSVSLDFDPRTYDLKFDVIQIIDFCILQTKKSYISAAGLGGLIGSNASKLQDQ